MYCNPTLIDQGDTRSLDVTVVPFGLCFEMCLVYLKHQTILMAQGVLTCYGLQLFLLNVQCFVLNFKTRLIEIKQC